MANKEHLETLAKGVAVWNEWRERDPNHRPDLSEAKLQSVNLRGFNLKDAMLMEADLTAARLTSAELRGALMAGATLNEADLRMAGLKGADMSRTRQIAADLSGADLKNATLANADLERCVPSWLPFQFHANCRCAAERNHVCRD
jgi:uncharacterized protein YjbI with pentapeptide repeats